LDDQGKKVAELQTQLVDAQVRFTFHDCVIDILTVSFDKQNANESKASAHVSTLERKKKELAQELAQLKTKVRLSPCMICPC
jgi:cell division protein FtsB